MLPPDAERLSTPGNFDRRADQQVEKLVADIAGVIRTAAPGKRAELKDLAEALLHDEISSIVESSTPPERATPAYRVNPLLPGVLIALVGVGFLLIFPMVALTLVALGAVLMIWGAAMSWFRK
jgi:hypothetical protein